MINVRFSTVALIVSLISACGGGGGGSPNGPTMSSIPLSVGEGQVYILNDQDYERYSFLALANTRYSIDVTNLEASSGQIRVEIEGVSARRVLSVNTITSFDFSSEAQTEVVLRVDGLSNAFFRYDISVHYGTDDGLEHDAHYEPNNSLYAAYPLISGATYNSRLARYDDYDWYSIDVVAGDTLSVELVSDPASVAYSLYWQAFNEDGHPLIAEQHVSRGNAGSREIAITETGRIFMRVKGGNPGVDMIYSIRGSISGVLN